jgi:hypothetical protein
MAGSPEHPGDHLIEVVVGEIAGALGHRLSVAEQVARLRGVGRDRNVLYRVALATAARSMIRSTPTVFTPFTGKSARLRRPATARARYERQTQS